MRYRTLVLIDGENLLARYEAMIASGRKPDPRVQHSPGGYVWNQEVTLSGMNDVVRASYFNVVVGDEPKVSSLEEEISALRCRFSPASGDGITTTRLVPRVFKKQGSRNKSVDINISIDALRHAYNRSIDRVFLISGDGDYLPLVQEVMRQGVQVHVGALSSGLNPALRTAADLFIDLDGLFAHAAV